MVSGCTSAETAGITFNNGNAAGGTEVGLMDGWLGRRVVWLDLLFRWD